MSYGFNTFDTGIPNTRGYESSTQDPQQRGLYQSLISGIQSNPAQQLSQMANGDESYYAPNEQQALRQFRQDVLPSIASRFVGRLGGSAAQGAFAQAGSNLSQDLFAQRAKMRQDATRDLLGLEKDLLGQKTFERKVLQDEPEENTWDKIQPWIKPAGKLAAGGIGFLAGGPAGATAGFTLANSIFGD